MQNKWCTKQLLVTVTDAQRVLEQWFSNQQVPLHSLFSMSPHGMEDPFEHFESTVPVLSPPNKKGQRMRAPFFLSNTGVNSKNKKGTLAFTLYCLNYSTGGNVEQNVFKDTSNGETPADWKWPTLHFSVYIPGWGFPPTPYKVIALKQSSKSLCDIEVRYVNKNPPAGATLGEDSLP